MMLLSFLLACLSLVLVARSQGLVDGVIWYPPVTQESLIVHCIASLGFPQRTMTTIFHAKLDAAVEWERLLTWKSQHPELKEFLERFASRPHQVAVIQDGLFYARTAISYVYYNGNNPEELATHEVWNLLVDSQKSFYDSRLKKYKAVTGSQKVVDWYHKELVPNHWPADALGYRGDLVFPGPGIGRDVGFLLSWIFGVDGSPIMTANPSMEPPLADGAWDDTVSGEGDDKVSGGGANTVSGEEDSNDVNFVKWTPRATTPRTMPGYAHSKGRFMIIILPKGVDDAEEELKVFLQSPLCRLDKAVKMRAHKVRVVEKTRDGQTVVASEKHFRGAITFYNSRTKEETPLDSWKNIFMVFVAWVSEARAKYRGRITGFREDKSFGILPQGYSQSRLYRIDDSKLIENAGYDTEIPLASRGPGPQPNVEVYFGKDDDESNSCMGEASADSVTKISVVADNGADNDVTKLASDWVIWPSRPYGDAMISAYAKAKGALMILVYPNDIDPEPELQEMLQNCLWNHGVIRTRIHQLRVDLDRNTMDPQKPRRPAMNTEVRKAIFFYNSLRRTETTYQEWHYVEWEILAWIKVKRVSNTAGPNRLAHMRLYETPVYKSIKGLGYDPKLENHGPDPDADLDVWFDVPKIQPGAEVEHMDVDTGQPNACVLDPAWQPSYPTDQGDNYNNIVEWWKRDETAEIDAQHQPSEDSFSQ